MGNIRKACVGPAEALRDGLTSTMCGINILPSRSLAFLTVIESDNNGSRSITSRLLLLLVLCMSRRSSSVIDYIPGDTAPLRPQRLMVVVVVVVLLFMMVVLMVVVMVMVVNS